MYEIVTRTKGAEKQFPNIISPSVKRKLEKLKQDPRREMNAHKLKGELSGYWSCYLGRDIRIIYEIDDKEKKIIISRAGTHKIYK